MMDITPKVHYLKSLRGERTNYADLIGEGVDNALDAGAACVRAAINDDGVVFEDDGSGITRDKIIALFSLGDHIEMATTALGRFGVGITMQAINFGNRMTVVSSSKDGRVTAYADWPQVLRSAKWEIPDAEWKPVLVGAQTGTTVAIEGLRIKPAFNVNKIIEDLSLVFYPAINAGRQIIFNGIGVPALSEPPMSNIIEARLTLSDDRTAHVRAGILSESSKLCRVHVSWKHRVLMPNNTIGCGGRGGLNRLFARVELSGPWHIHRFKNDLTSESERDELDDALAELLEPILVKCDSASMDAKLARITAAVNAGLPDHLAMRRPERKQPLNRVGEKKGRIGEVDADKSKDKGPARSRKENRDQLKITFDGSDENDGIGALRQGGRIIHIDFSKDNPFIEELFANRDERLIAGCIRALAYMIFEAERNKLAAQGELKGLDFGRRVAMHIKAQNRA